jgi:hypothetical protein
LDVTIRNLKIFLSGKYSAGIERHGGYALSISEQGGTGGIRDPIGREHAQISARGCAIWRRAPLPDVCI